VNYDLWISSEGEKKNAKRKEKREMKKRLENIIIKRSKVRHSLSAANTGTSVLKARPLGFKRFHFFSV